MSATVRRKLEVFGRVMTRPNTPHLTNWVNPMRFKTKDHAFDNHARSDAFILKRETFTEV